MFRYCGPHQICTTLQTDIVPLSDLVRAWNAVSNEWVEEISVSLVV